MKHKIILVSRCAWTLYNFRAGLIGTLKRNGGTVICGGAGGDGFEEKVESLGVPFVHLPISKNGVNPLGDLTLFLALYRWYRKERPHVVHHFTIKPVIYGSMAARLAKVPRIVNTVTGLGYVYTDEARGWLRRIVTWQYRLALACADFTFFQNRDDLALFLTRRLVKPWKADVLRGSGVDCSYFTPDRCATPRPGNPVTFLMVARLLRAKGVYQFIEAARLVKQRFPTVCFHLLGTRDERNPTVVSESELECWQQERMVGWLGDVADVRPVMAGADVVVLPSYYREGTPRALLEAAALGKPIITTDFVGCRDVVVDGVNGLLVPVKDAKALAQAMIHMIENPTMRERMGKAGREKVEREFDERIVIARILQAYTEGDA